MDMVIPAALPFTSSLTSKLAPESQRCATAPPSARSARFIQERAQAGSPEEGDAGEFFERGALAALSPKPRRQPLLPRWEEFLNESIDSASESWSPPARPASTPPVRQAPPRPHSLSAPLTSEELTVSEYRSITTVGTPRSDSVRARLDVDWGLRQEVKQLKVELNSAVAELMEAKAELSLLRPGGTDSLRRAKAFLAMQGVASTAANGDVPFRFVPLCGAKELVRSKQQAAQQTVVRSSPKAHTEQGTESYVAKLKGQITGLEDQLLETRTKFQKLQAEAMEMHTKYEQSQVEREQIQVEHERLVDLVRQVAKLCLKRKSSGAPAHNSSLLESPEKLLQDCIVSLEERNFQDEQPLQRQFSGNREGESKSGISAASRFSLDCAESLERCLKKAKFHVEAGGDHASFQPRKACKTVACQTEKDKKSHRRYTSLSRLGQGRVKQLWQFAADAVRRFNAIKLQGLSPVWKFAAVILQDTCQRLAGDVQATGAEDLSIWEFAAQRVRDEEFTARTRLLRDMIEVEASLPRRNSEGSRLVGPPSPTKQEGRSSSLTVPADTPTNPGLRASGRLSIEHMSTKYIQACEQFMYARRTKAFEAAGGRGLVEQCYQQINPLLRRIREARPVGRVCQDVGYTTLGLDNLFEECARRREKLTNEVQRIAEKTDGEWWVPDLKDRERARSKILTKLSDDTASLTDLLRASICYEGIRQLYSALRDTLESDLKCSRRDFFICEVEDHFLKSKDGYRNIVLHFDIDGVICEVQLHCKQILQTVKSGTQEIYKKARLVHELLFEACVRNNVHELVSLARCLQTSASGIRDRYGRTALHYACQHGSAVAVRNLMKFSADPWAEDRDGILPCELALRARHFDALALVLAQMCDSSPKDARVARRLAEHSMLWWCDHTAHTQSGMTAMELEVCDSSARRRDSYVDIEVGKGLGSDWAYAGRLLWRVLQQHPGLGGERILDKWLSSAASAGEVGRVLALLSTGFDMSVERGRASAMDCAIEGGHVELAEKLRAVHVLHKSECCTCWLRHVNEHLREASKEEDGPRALAALKARADPNDIKSKAPGKRTPLMAFSAAGDLSITKTLITCQAQVGYQDAFGSWAVHYAQAFGHVDVQNLLLSIRKPPDVPMHKFLQTSKWTHTKDFMVEAVRAGCCAASWRLNTDEETAEAFQENLHAPTGPHSYTLLHIAVQAVRENDRAGQVCRSLLMLRADGMAKARHGETPLHLLAYEGNGSLYNQMLEAIQAQALEESNHELDDHDNLLAEDPHELLRRKLSKKETQDRERYSVERGSQRETAADGRLFLEIGLFGLKHNRLASLVAARRHEELKSRHLEVREKQAAIIATLGSKRSSAKSERSSAEDSSSETSDASGLSDVSETKVEFVGKRSKADEQQASSNKATGSEYCKVCGNRFMPDAIFCRKCGRKRVQAQHDGRISIDKNKLAKRRLSRFRRERT